MQPNIQLNGGRLAILHTGLLKKYRFDRFYHCVLPLVIGSRGQRLWFAGHNGKSGDLYFFSNPLHTSAPMAEVRVAEPNLSVPERGTTGPIPIGQVMEPIRCIIAHPDRGRLLAEFCRRHW